VGLFNPTTNIAERWRKGRINNPVWPYANTDENRATALRNSRDRLVAALLHYDGKYHRLENMTEAEARRLSMDEYRKRRLRGEGA
jgi:hypothetical protein